MWRLLAAINKHLVITIPVMMVLGFVYGFFFPAAFLKLLIIPLTFLMVYPMMVTLKFKKVLEGGDFKAQLMTQGINFAIVPFIAYGLGLIFFKDAPYMALGLLLTGLVPTSGMTISWTGFAKGNVAAAVKMTVIGLTLGSIATPFYVKALMGATIDVNMMLVVKQIVIIVFLPMIAGFITRQTLLNKYGEKNFQTRIAPRIPGLSTLGVVGIVFVAMALKAKGIAAAPQQMLYILIPLILIYLINFTLSTLVGRLFLPRGDAIALVYGSVMRNLSIALAIAINAFGAQGSSAALVVAIAYIIQVQSAAWYVRFTDQLLGGKTDADKAKEGAVVSEKAAQINADAASAWVPAFRRILFATDLSENARHAVRYACSIGHRYGAHVTILHAIPDMLEAYSTESGTDLKQMAADRDPADWSAESIEAAREIIQKRVQEMSEHVTAEIPVCPLSTGDIRVEVGSPVSTITRIAQSESYDLIIMGTHGHSGLENILMGSVAEGVVKHSSVPVLVVRLPEE